MLGLCRSTCVVLSMKNQASATCLGNNGSQSESSPGQGASADCNLVDLLDLGPSASTGGEEPRHHPCRHLAWGPLLRPWYILEMMGLHTPLSSFCFCPQTPPTPPAGCRPANQWPPGPRPQSFSPCPQGPACLQCCHPCRDRQDGTENTTISVRTVRQGLEGTTCRHKREVVLYAPALKGRKW